MVNTRSAGDDEVPGADSVDPNIANEALIAMLAEIKDRLTAIETNNVAPSGGVSTRSGLCANVEAPVGTTASRSVLSTPPLAYAVAPTLLERRELPRFEGLPKHHPVVFLRELERFFEMVGVKEAFQLDYALDALQGKISTWGDAFRYSFGDYPTFKAMFLEEFWGEERQRDIRVALYGETYRSNCDLEMADYFLRLVAKARHLTPPMRDDEIISLSIRHFPMAVERTLLAAGHDSVDMVLKLLRRLDEAERRRGPRSRPQQERGDVRGPTRGPYFGQNDVRFNRQAAGRHEAPKALVAQVEASPHQGGN